MNRNESVLSALKIKLQICLSSSSKLKFSNFGIFNFESFEESSDSRSSYSIDFDFRFTCEEGFFDKMISGASRPIFRVGTKYWSEFKKKPFDVKKIDEQKDVK